MSVLEEIKPGTARQVFYQLASYLQVIPKTEAQYKSTVIRLLSKMRRDKTIPFGWLSDNTRWMRKPTSYSSLEALLKDTAATYRRSVWDQQNAYVEVWLEKDALAGVFYDVTAVWDVPLMVTRGFPSISFLHTAAEVMADHAWNGKEIFVYYFGDRDPSGLTVDRTVERDLKEFAQGAEINFQRVAVTPNQITEWDLPTRPTKRTGNKHAKNFIGDSVELDAIPPAKLRELIESCITQHLDPSTHNALVAAEESERETLAAFVQTFSNGRDLDHAG